MKEEEGLQFGINISMKECRSGMDLLFIANGIDTVLAQFS